MRTSQVVLVSVIASLVTLLAAFAFLGAGNVALAQKPEPVDKDAVAPLTQPVLSAADATDPNTMTQPSKSGEPGGPVIPEALDPNYGIPQSPGHPEPGVPEAIRYTHVAASTFVPLYGDTNPSYDTIGCIHPTGPIGHAHFNFPIVVPDGSRITELRIYWIDNSASNDGIMRIAEYDDGNSYTYLTQASTTGSGGWSTTTVSNLTIDPDNYNYNYVFLWSPTTTDGSIQLCAARVGYTPPVGTTQLLPGVLHNAHP